MLAALRSDDVRSQNRRRVLAVIRRNGVASRTDIGNSTGLSAATVSAITSDFLAEGILLPPESKSVPSSGRGRPKVSLMVNPDAAIVCAVYFQLNRLSAVMVDYSGATISEFSTEFASRKITSNEIRQALIHCIEKALRLASRSASKLRRIAVGFQGVTDVEGSMVLWTPICRQRDIRLCQWLEDHFGVPARVANDCDMIAQALNLREPEKYGRNFGVVLLAHGVGMGLYLREGIINGTRSSGVEFGHMTYIPGGALCRCGNRGCIEAYAGDYGISRRAKGQPEDTPPPDLLESPNLKSTMELVQAGDENALAAVNEAGAAIGTGLANLFALVDPFPIVLVGQGAIFFEQMEASIRERLGTAPGDFDEKRIKIDCYPHENPLVQEGCAISALLAHDEELSSRRIQTEAAE
ncbi:MAG: ROK family transcriptional regulator [Pseudomonadota bacterium]